MKRIALVYLWLLNSLAFAQDSLKTFEQAVTQWELTAHLGLILPHAEELTRYRQRKPFGLQASWGKTLLSQKAYASCNCYTQVGVLASYFNFGLPSELGSATGISIFAAPYINFQNKVQTRLKLATGPVYLNRVYHPESNPNNTFFSAHLSFLLLAGIQVSYPLNDKYSLLSGATYNHISNGGWKQPNRGMNFPTLQLGLQYTPNPQPTTKWPKIQSRKGTTRLNSRLFAALPKVESAAKESTDRRLQLGVAVNGQYFLSQLSALTIGLEAIRHGNIRAQGRLDGARYDYHQIGGLVGHAFVLGKFSFGQQLGWYLYRPYPSPKPRIYQRYELMVELGRNWQVGTGLKAHGKTAENLDLRLGYLLLR